VLQVEQAPVDGDLERQGARLPARLGRHHPGLHAHLVRGLARAGGGHAVLEAAPLAVKAHVPVWDDPGAAERIMQRIKAQLDPLNILNPGRFVAGI